MVALMSEFSTTVLFADLSGSVPLYEALGDSAAKAIVVELQSQLGNIVAECSGVVQEVIGDEIMCRFERADQAVACAARIHQSTADYCTNNDTSSAYKLEMRIGIHSGTAIFDNNRLFGDTINTAARIMSVAQASQTITSEAVLKQLSEHLQHSAREFDEITLKGKSAPTTIYDFPWELQDLTQIKHTSTAPTRTTLNLISDDKSASITTHDCPVYLGRAINSLLVVDSEPVSRRHVAIEHLRGRFVVSDKSTNGTYVYPDNGETLFLRREQMPLWGSGRICLGAPDNESAGHIIKYQCS